MQQLKRQAKISFYDTHNIAYREVFTELSLTPWGEVASDLDAIVGADSQLMFVCCKVEICLTDKPTPATSEDDLFREVSGEREDELSQSKA